MAFCTECGTQVADSAKFCQQCGNPLGDSQAEPSPTPVDSEPVSSETETALGGSQAEPSPMPVSPEADPPMPVDSKPVSSETETALGGSQAVDPPTPDVIGKGGILLCVLFIFGMFYVFGYEAWDPNAYAGLVVGWICLVVPGVAIFKPNRKIWLGTRRVNFCIALLGGYLIIFSVYHPQPREESPNQSATTRSIGAVTRLTSTPTPTLTPTPTATPIPTATPTRPPMVMQIDALLNEYTENKVRANARLRYQENGKIPVTFSGYVSEVDELHVDIQPRQLNRELSYRGVNCYYSNVKAALHLDKGQLITITGKISGEDDYSTRIAIFDCEIKGFSFPTLPIFHAQVVRKNTVEVFCTAQSLFGTTLYKKGTGVIIDPSAGLILTVHHVIDDDCEKIEVEIPGRAERVPASIDKHCASIDRAHLRIPPRALTGLAIQPIYRAAAPAQVDQEMYFWGFGTGELRLETGVVTSVSSIWGDSTSTDAHAIPGDSGSPVYNEYGHLLGTMSRSNSSDRAVYTGKQC